ncbi:MAG TPA: zinc-binding alcohol dehydrogenase [Cellvibrio sp.]|nr:zinc-binding alcohol dehydrogenase [Cellvibrio sp.]
MKKIAQQLWFTGQQQVEVRVRELELPAPDEVLVEVNCSAISAGTEMLVYRGQLPAEIALDANIESLQSQNYPLQYGYACVGTVIQLGENVDDSWLGQTVFAFQPHASHFVSRVESLIPVPADISAEDAVFLANMETAVNLLHDGKPVVGERVLVLGQGIVGLLLTSLLAQLPLTETLVADKWLVRRQLANQLGANSFDPLIAEERKAQQSRLEKEQGADLIFELTGVPDVLNLAIDFSGYHSRIVIGSWYGTKTASVYLGGAAHRNRLQIVTSQVSSIAPELTGRWNKARRFDVTWDMIRRFKPSRFISHRNALDDAPIIYEYLDQQAESLIQALFVY